MLKRFPRSGFCRASLFLLLVGSLGSQMGVSAHADTQKAIKAFDRKDYNTAYREFLESAELGDAEAQAGVGSMLMMKMNPPGTGIYADSEEWLKRSANQGNTKGMTWLAKFYYNDAQRYKNVHGTQNAYGQTAGSSGSGIRDGRSGSASSYNPRSSMFPSMRGGALSSFFGGGGNIPQRVGSVAGPWVATRPGNPGFNMPSRVASGMNYFKGQDPGEADLQKARYWFQQAAERGDGYAMGNLAILMDSGIGGPRDPQGAAQWRAKMTHKTDATFARKVKSDPAAQAMKADFIQGRYTEALQTARRLAQVGNASGMAILGQAYYEGKGVPRNDAEARLWLQKGALKNNADCQYYLGLMYEWGRGVPRDSKKAIALFDQAARQGQTFAKSEAELLRAQVENNAWMAKNYHPGNDDSESCTRAGGVYGGATGMCVDSGGSYIDPNGLPR